MPIFNKNIVKHNGQCLNRAIWQYCYFWRAKTNLENGKTLGYFCALFNEDKEGLNSIPKCNSQYGLNYNGKTV